MKRKINLNIGINPSVSRQFNRIATNFDPIVKEIAQINQIDIYATLPEPVISYDKILFFTALLITNHPRIIERINDIRESIKLNQLLIYTKEFDQENIEFYNTTLFELESSLKEKLQNSLTIFFADMGKNLPKADWMSAISTYILTGTLPLPFMPLDSFKINSNQNVSELKESARYPVIIIKKRIKRHEFNQLIEFIKESGYRLEKATRHLQSEVVKRFDVDLTKLAIGLWIYNNDKLGNEKMEEWIEERWKKDENYFGEYILGRSDFPNFKSDAVAYLNQFYPL